MIGQALWRDRFGADPAVVGKAITLDGKPHTVVGVLPPGFQLPAADRPTAAFELTTKVDAIAPLRLPTDLGWVGDFNYVAIGRLKSGVSVEQARADLNVIQNRIAVRVSEEAGQPATMRALVIPLTEAVVGGARRGLVLLMGAIVAVLLIACANLANLSLTRATVRIRDAMIKTALGASRARLVGQLLTEQLIVAGAGGALGMLVARVSLQTFVRTAPIDLPRVAEVTIDGRVMAFAAVVSIATALLTALLPAWRLGRNEQVSLRATGAATTADRHALRTRSALLAVQVALSVALLVVTGLFAVSFTRLMRVDRGFSAEHVLAVDVALPSSRYDKPASRIDTYDRVLAGVRALPGVESVAWASALPLKGEDWGDMVTAEGDLRPMFERPLASYRFVAPDYFKTLTIPLKRGRAFTDSERSETSPATPAVISEKTAAVVWPGQDALGKRFRRGGPEKPLEVVGITADVRTTSIDGAMPLMVYVPYWYRSRAAASLVVRTGADPAFDVRRGAAGGSGSRLRHRDWRVASDPAGRRCVARRAPLPDDAVCRLRRLGALDRGRWRLRGDRVRRVAAPARDEHSSCARRARVTGRGPGAAPDRRASRRRRGCRRRRGDRDRRRRRQPAVRGARARSVRHRRDSGVGDRGRHADVRRCREAGTATQSGGGAARRVAQPFRAASRSERPLAGLKARPRMRSRARRMRDDRPHRADD